MTNHRLGIIVLVVGLLTLGALGLNWLLWRDVRWLGGLQREAVVGMTRADVISRMGPPHRVYAPGSEEWRRGFAHLERPIEHELLVWTLFSPAHVAWRLFVYVDANDTVTCVYFGSTQGCTTAPPP